MSDEVEAGFVMADTNVIVHLTKASPLAGRYEELRAGRRIALSFQVRAELGGFPASAGWGTARQERLADFLLGCVEVPHSEAASTWYARVNEKLHQLGSPASKPDIWVIAQALEHHCPLMTHDRKAAELAAAMGVEVLTALDQWPGP